jgi:hypothetical protein
MVASSFIKFVENRNHPISTPPPHQTKNCPQKYLHKKFNQKLFNIISIFFSTKKTKKNGMPFIETYF